MKKMICLFILLSAVLGYNYKSFAHCEIPCGIYDDRMRIDMLKEDTQTIEKSMDMINKLSSSDNKDLNQIVRWIDNKEEHANKIQEIVYQYFLNQRIIPVEKDGSKMYGVYINELTILHQILIYAMKSKQSTDIANTEKLYELIDTFEKVYFQEDLL